MRDVGRVGEEVFEAWAVRQAGVEAVRDVRDDPVYQRDEVDYIVTRTVKPDLRVEVKTETKLDVSGNILIELVRINHSGQHQYVLEGWPWRTVSDVVVYYAPATGRLHFWDRRDFLACIYEWVRLRGKSLRTLVTETSTDRVVISTVMPMDPYMTGRKSYLVTHKDEEEGYEQEHRGLIDGDEDQSEGGAAYY